MLEEGYGQDYLEWKNWGGEGFAAVSPAEKAYFAAEISRLPVSADAPLSVLEIGFGNGAFLGFARAQGWAASGTELIPGLVDCANRCGFDAKGDLAEFAENSFDLIVAFDVLEHIPTDQVLDFMAAVKRVAKPGAIFLARFPNGDSPIGLSYQNGDLTHINAIGSSKLRHLATRSGAEVVFVAGMAKTNVGLSYKGRIKQAALVPVHATINRFITFAFLPGWEGVNFCSPNAVAALRL